MRALLAIQLAAALALAACVKLGELQHNVVAPAVVNFQVEALAPLPGLVAVVYPGRPNATRMWGLSVREVPWVALAAVVEDAEWDRDLVFTATVGYYAPEPWTLEEWTDGFHIIYRAARIPHKDYLKIDFVINKNAAGLKTQKIIYVSEIPPLPLCSAVYNTTEGRCGCSALDLHGEVRVTGPGTWMALRINGRRPGDVVEAFGVRAATPNPWLYTDTASIGGFPFGVTVETDMGTAALGAEARFVKRIDIRGFLVPAEWGYAEFVGPRPMPLLVSRVASIGTGCSPPSCFLVGNAGNSTWVGAGWVWRGTLAAVASPSGVALVPYVAVRPRDVVDNGTPAAALWRSVTVYMPLGSAWEFTPMVLWRLDWGPRSAWVRSYPTALRVVDDRGELIDYMGLAAAGKLAYSLPDYYASLAGGPMGPSVGLAVDGGVRRIRTAWYAAPDPCRGGGLPCISSQHVFTKVNGSWTGYAQVGPRGDARWELRTLEISSWLVLSNPVGGSFVDLMSLLLGDPHYLFRHRYRVSSWEFSGATGDFDMPTVQEYPGPHMVSLVSRLVGDGRTTTEAGAPLNLTTYGAFYDYVMIGPEGAEYPGGWTDAKPLGLPSSPQVSGVGPWVVQLIPATACRSALCGGLDVELWGPFPSPVPSLALPVRGYAFAVIYVGRGEETGLRLYVERGAVAGPDGRLTEVGAGWDPLRGGGGLLAEVPRRAWRFGDAVFLGPGWWREATALAPCQVLRLGGVGLYVTPNWRGPVGLTLETDSGARFNFVFFTSDRAGLEIRAVAEAPESFTTPSLNVTVGLRVEGVPLFHALTAFGEGGREVKGVCVDSGGFAQLTASGDYGGFVELLARVNISRRPLRPVLQLLDGGLVRISAPAGLAAHVRGYALYLNRGGTWLKVAVLAGEDAVVNASRLWPWDPLLVVPLTEQRVDASDGESVELYVPAPVLVFRWWGGGWPPPGTPSSI